MSHYAPHLAHEVHERRSEREAAASSVLSLDLATVCGWATRGGGVVTSGSQDFTRYAGSKSRRRDHPGASFAMFHRWLTEKIRTDKPAQIAYEEVRRWSGYSAAYCFCAYRGTMLGLAAVAGIPCYGYLPGEIKRFWTGNWCAQKYEMERATLRRFPELNLTDSNEADALAILHLHVEHPGTAVR